MLGLKIVMGNKGADIYTYLVVLVPLNNSASLHILLFLSFASALTLTATASKRTAVPKATVSFTSVQCQRQNFHGEGANLSNIYSYTRSIFSVPYAPILAPPLPVQRELQQMIMAAWW